MSSGHAQTVGLLPVFGACSISSYRRGFPWLCPSDSIRMARSRLARAARYVTYVTHAKPPARNAQHKSIISPASAPTQRPNNLLLNPARQLAGEYSGDEFA